MKNSKGENAMLIVLKYSIEDDGTVSVATEKHRLNNSGEIETEVSNPKKFRSKNVDRCISKYAKEFRTRSFQTARAWDR